VASGQHCCIFFVVFPSSRFMFHRNSPISFHLPLDSSARLNTTYHGYALHLLFCSGSDSTCILCKFATLVFSREFSTSGLGSPSPRDRCERPSEPQSSLPGTRFMLKLNSHIHGTQRATSAAGRSGRADLVDAIISSYLSLQEI
jgi:hypothetical protein